MCTNLKSHTIDQIAIVGVNKKYERTRLNPAHDMVSKLSDLAGTGITPAQKDPEDQSVLKRSKSLQSQSSDCDCNG